jgi:hypothetical protein
VTLSGAANATIATPQGTGTILNDDVLPTLSINNVSVSEGNSSSTLATFTVTLSAASGSTTTVAYATANGTATAGSDYTATSGTLTLAPGATTQTISVPVLGDTQSEADETFGVMLSGAASATIATPQGTGTILNDDAASSSSWSLQFNGSNSRARFTTLPSMTVFTVEAWVKRTAAMGRYETFASNASSGYSRETFGLYVDGGNVDCGSSPPQQFAWAYMKTTGGWFTQCSGVTANLNTWHHVAVTRDAASNTRIFIDGVLRGTIANSAAPTASSGAFGLGEAGDALEEYFSGLLDEVRISNIVRYTATFTPQVVNFSSDTNTVALYHLDETSGQTLLDSSGNSQHGVLGWSSSAESVDPVRSADVPVR